MANQADGYIIINTKINTDGMKAGTAEIEAACRRAAAKVASIGDAAAKSANKAFSAFQKQNNLFAEQAQKVSELKSKLREIGDSKVETSEFSSLNSEIDSLNQKLDAAIERQIRFVETGGNLNTRTFAGMEYDIENLRIKIAEAETEKAKLISSGGAYTSPDVSKLAAQISVEEQKLQSIGYKVGDAYDRLGETVSKYTSESAKASKSTKSLTDSTDKLQKSINKGFKNFLRYGIGIRSVFALFNRIRRGIGEGLKNIVQVDPEANKAISTLRSSLGMLKNALAAAFTPIIEVITPYIKIFVEKLVDAINYVGMFFAVLAGKKTYTKAIAYQEDYAASLNNTSKAAASAKRNLTGLDEISNWQSGNDMASSVGTTAEQMFETVEISEDFVEKVHNIVKKFKELKEKLVECKNWVIAIGAAIALWKIAEVITNFTTVATTLSGISSTLGIIAGIGVIGIEIALISNLPTFVEGIREVLDPQEADWIKDVNFWDNFWDILFGEDEAYEGDMEKVKSSTKEIADNLRDAGYEGVAQSLEEDTGDKWSKLLSPPDLAKQSEEYWKSMGTNAAEGFTNSLEGQGTFLGKVKLVFKAIVNGVKKVLGINSPSKVFKSIGDFCMEGFLNGFNNLSAKVKEIFENVKEKIKSPINGIIGFINKMISGIVSGINAAIEAMNKLKFDVPSWVPVIGGNKFGFNISLLTPKQIPYLATGAVIPPNAPFMAFLGDQKNGKNLEAPESLIRKIVREESGDSGGSFTFIAELDSEVVFKKIVKKAEIKKRSTGKNPLLV